MCCGPAVCDSAHDGLGQAKSKEIKRGCALRASPKRTARQRSPFPRSGPSQIENLPEDSKCRGTRYFNHPPLPSAAAVRSFDRLPSITLCEASFTHVFPERTPCDPVPPTNDSSYGGVGLQKVGSNKSARRARKP